jgi:hypothetical protein
MYIVKPKETDKSQTIGDFLLGKTLGEGTFGKVILGTHIPTGEKVTKYLNRLPSKF